MVDLPSAMGNPRYCSPRASEAMPRVSSTIFFASSSQFALKNIADFCLLTSCPYPLWYESRIICNLVAPPPEAWQNIMQSSAKRRCDNHGAWTLTLMPQAKYRGPWNFSIADRPFAHRSNRQGEIGSPCLIPLVGLKKSEYCPFIFTEKETERTHCMTRLIHNSANPIFSICFSRYAHLTLGLGHINVGSKIKITSCPWQVPEVHW